MSSSYPTTTATGSASHASQAPALRRAMTPYTANRGTRPIPTYLVRKARAASAAPPASGPFRPVRMPRIQSTVAQVHEQSWGTSHMRVVLDTKKAGVAAATSSDSVGGASSSRARNQIPASAPRAHGSIAT